jgi:hypothetical protein
MGREIRRVPPNWEHPKGEFARLDGWKEEYKPLYDRNYQSAAEEWIREFDDYRTNPKEAENRATYPYYWDWNGMPPDKDSYVPYDPTDESLCTWWQCYETVSEGTPVSPPFATAEELIDYLATHGDFWEQRRARDGRRPLNLSSREAVSRFVLGTGWAPSMVSVHDASGVRTATGIEAMELLRSGKDES